MSMSLHVFRKVLEMIPFDLWWSLLADHEFVSDTITSCDGQVPQKASIPDPPTGGLI
jgi:hypothetical protein